MAIWNDTSSEISMSFSMRGVSDEDSPLVNLVVRKGGLSSVVEADAAPGLNG
jgi:hypothetical protein